MPGACCHKKRRYRKEDEEVAGAILRGAGKALGFGGKVLQHTANIASKPLGWGADAVAHVAGKHKLFSAGFGAVGAGSIYGASKFANKGYAMEDQDINKVNVRAGINRGREAVSRYWDSRKPGTKRAIQIGGMLFGGAAAIGAGSAVGTRMGYAQIKRKNKKTRKGEGMDSQNLRKYLDTKLDEAGIEKGLLQTAAVGVEEAAGAIGRGISRFGMKMRRGGIDSVTNKIVRNTNGVREPIKRQLAAGALGGKESDVNFAGSIGVKPSFGEKAKFKIGGAIARHPGATAGIVGGTAAVGAGVGIGAGMRRKNNNDEDYEGGKDGGFEVKVGTSKLSRSTSKAERSVDIRKLASPTGIDIIGELTRAGVVLKRK